MEPRLQTTQWRGECLSLWVSRSMTSSREMEPWNHSLPRLGSSSVWSPRESERVRERERERESESVHTHCCVDCFYYTCQLLANPFPTILPLTPPPPQCHPPYHTLSPSLPPFLIPPTLIFPLQVGGYEMYTMHTHHTHTLLPPSPRPP